MSVLLLSTYDLGKQPFGLASAVAWLRQSRLTVSVCDLSRTPLDEAVVASAALIGCYLPMHTATRLALPLLQRVRALAPHAHLTAFGLYAPLSEQVLRDAGVTTILGAEFEEDLVRLAEAVTAGAPMPSKAEPLPSPRSGVVSRPLPKLRFVTPDRRDLPALDRYAKLQLPDGSIRRVGATDTTRGCKHRCRHCPVVPVYQGQFRVVPLDVVMADVAQQVTSGAQHLSFGDPDFFNGPAHARRVVDALHQRFPQLTYDVTIKVEHLLRHRHLLPVLVKTGCLFVTTAVESVDDRVLAQLEKGHTRADFETVAERCRDIGLQLSPTFVAFTPWTTHEGYRDLLAVIDRLRLVTHVAPVQWTLRLLITQGSRLLELPDIRDRVSGFDPASLTHVWRHRDPTVDQLQHDITALVGVRLGKGRQDVFDEVSARAGYRPETGASVPPRATIPYLNEPWYC